MQTAPGGGRRDACADANSDAATLHPALHRLSHGATSSNLPMARKGGRKLRFEGRSDDVIGAPPQSEMLILKPTKSHRLLMEYHGQNPSTTSAGNKRGGREPAFEWEIFDGCGCGARDPFPRRSTVATASRSKAPPSAFVLFSRDRGAEKADARSPMGEPGCGLLHVGPDRRRILVFENRGLTSGTQCTHDTPRRAVRRVGYLTGAARLMQISRGGLPRM